MVMNSVAGEQTQTTTAQAVAVFDLEGTLCQGGSFLWREMIRWQFEYSMPTRLMCRLGLTRRGARVGIIKDLAPLLKGLCEEEIQRLASQISEMMVARLRPDIQAILQDHKQRGHGIVLVSTMFQPFLEVTGRRLDVDLNIGTELEKTGPYYSGQTSSPICFNEHRASLLRKRVGEIGLEIETSGSYAYGDTIWDKPVLQMVGNPVAVYPDSRLRAHARERGWKIIG
jgi:HAD superfamily phosphoserine phosphatase-like hydrolase